jgi:hypothetical protein
LPEKTVMDSKHKVYINHSPLFSIVYPSISASQAILMPVPVRLQASLKPQVQMCSWSLY